MENEASAQSSDHIGQAALTLNLKHNGLTRCVTGQCGLQGFDAGQGFAVDRVEDIARKEETSRWFC